MLVTSFPTTSILLSSPALQDNVMHLWSQVKGHFDELVLLVPMNLLRLFLHEQCPPNKSAAIELVFS